MVANDEGVPCGGVRGLFHPCQPDWGDAVMQLSRRSGDTLDGVDTPLRANVIFHVPPAVVPVDFSGMRTGRYSGRASQLGTAGTPPPSVEEDDHRGTAPRAGSRTPDIAARCGDGLRA